MLYLVAASFVLSEYFLLMSVWCKLGKFFGSFMGCCFLLWSALERLRGCEVQSSELDEILQEQAETKGMRPRRPWELFTDRSVRWQLISVIIISSAMQLCGNDSVRSGSVPEVGFVEKKLKVWSILVKCFCQCS